jgi:hypothetical protein
LGNDPRATRGDKVKGDDMTETTALQFKPETSKSGDPWINKPTITFDRIEWEETGCDVDPRSRMLATLLIGEMPMHLEAWRVTGIDDADYQKFKCRCAESEDAGHCLGEAYEDVAKLNSDGPFQTIEVEGAQYGLVAQPFGD